VFEIPASHAQFVEANWESMMLACFPVAMYHGESRLFADGSVCPMLLEGIRTASSWLRHWHRDRYGEVRFESRAVSDRGRDGALGRAGLFLSGGIDSLATLGHNRLTVPRTHPMSVRAGVVVEGFDVGHLGTTEASRRLFRSVVDGLRPVALDAQIELIPVTTNLRQLEPELLFWVQAFHGAALSAVAHVLRNGFDLFMISSTNDVAWMDPWGSHPLLDPHYGSSGMTIHHALERMDRFEKTRLVSQWDAALRAVRVCTHATANLASRNCGRCEKCIRTMASLEALGVLDRATSFPFRRVTPELLRTVVFWEEWQVKRYEALIEPLEARGRGDLASVIRAQVRRFRLKSSLKAFDDHLFGGRLQQARRRVLRLPDESGSRRDTKRPTSWRESGVRA
jgi:hypothetical protein